MTDKAATTTGDRQRRIEALLRKVSDLLLAENRVRGGDWSFSGWTADGRPVRHTFRLTGYVRSGKAVEAERIERPAGLSADGAVCPLCGKPGCDGACAAADQ